jgi:ATP-binding cassette subfamily C protein CydD
MVDKRLIKQVKQHKQRFLLLVGFAVISGILTVLQADYLAKIKNGAFLESLDWTRVWQWMGALFAVMALRSVFVWLIEVTAHAVRLFSPSTNQIGSKFNPRILWFFSLRF